MSKAFHKGRYRSALYARHTQSHKEQQRQLNARAQSTLSGLALGELFRQQTLRNEHTMQVVGLYVAALSPRRRRL